MRIDLRNFVSETAGAERSSRNQGAKNRAEAAWDPESTGELRLTGLAAEVIALPEVRQERVLALRSKIVSGTYQVSDEALANAILRDKLR